MCKHTQILEAMRSAIVQANSIERYRTEPRQETIRSLSRQENAYEALLDPMYTKGCEVCQSLIYSPEAVERHIEETWMSKTLLYVAMYAQ